jgi:hypothetical protein
VDASDSVETEQQGARAIDISHRTIKCIYGDGEIDNAIKGKVRESSAKSDLVLLDIRMDLRAQSTDALYSRWQCGKPLAQATI